MWHGKKKGKCIAKCPKQEQIFRSAEMKKQRIQKLSNCNS